MTWNEFAQICTVLQLEFRPTGDHQLWIADHVSLGPAGLTKPRCCCPNRNGGGSDGAMMDAAVPLLEAEGEEAETAMSAELHERTRSVDSTSSSTSSSTRPPLSPFMRRCRRIALNGIPSWSRIAKSWYFEGIVCAAVMTDFLCVIIELERPGQPRVEWVVAEFLISVAFVLELVFEVVAFGPKRFCW